MGIIQGIAAKVAESAVAAASPPAALALKALGGMKAALIWWFSSEVRRWITAFAVVLLYALHLNGLIKQRDAQIVDQRKQFTEQQERSRKIAEEALLHQNAVSAANAAREQQNHEKELASAQQALDLYISRNRYRPALQLQPQQAGGGASSASAAANGDGAAIPPAVPADTVLVSVGDLQKCNTAVTYAIDAHNWALTVNEVK